MIVRTRTLSCSSNNIDGFALIHSQIPSFIHDPQYMLFFFKYSVNYESLIITEDPEVAKCFETLQ